MSKGDSYLKKGFLPKKAIGKATLKFSSYKSRWFILTDEVLSYYDGAHERGPNKEKGNVPLVNVRAVEEVEDGTLDKKNNVFQVVFVEGGQEYILYVVAQSPDDRSDWINAIHQAWQKVAQCNPNPMYHRHAWQKDQYPCCRARQRSDRGCTPTRWRGNRPSIANGDTRSRRSLPKPPEFDGSPEASPAVSPATPSSPVRRQEPKKKVIALFDFTPIEQNDLTLEKGLEYDVLDDSRPNWWRARNSCGQEGNIPANHVQDKEVYQGSLEQYDWYYGDITRFMAEQLLWQDGRVGCFLVKKSSSGNMYTLCLNANQGSSMITRHYHIKQNKVGYYLNDVKPFSQMAALIDYHKRNPSGLASRLLYSPQPASSRSSVPPGMPVDMNEIRSEDLLTVRELGRGQFGCVTLARYHNFEVAVKTLKPGTMSEDLFIEEALTMSRLNHPHLVKFHGACIRERPIKIITEYMCNGSLLEYIRRNRELLRRTALLLEMALQVCKGMRYLEHENVIHRDLAARNCLVGDCLEGDRLIVKVGDFGLSRFVIDDDYTSSQGSKFPVRWAPPEVISFSKFSSKSDVWAYGILLHELFTGGEMPYRAQSTQEVCSFVAAKGCSLPRSQYCPQKVYQLMQRCWSFNAADRPSFADLQLRMTVLAERE